jgi:ABC-2 type transport system permease protein
VLNGWGGFAVLAGEVVVIGAIAIAAARRRDV